MAVSRKVLARDRHSGYLSNWHDRKSRLLSFLPPADMLHSLLLTSSLILGLASSCSAGLLGRNVNYRRSIPHDGQYIDVNSGNNATEWWWVQAGGPAENGGAPPSLHVTFYQGYPLTPLREAAGGSNAPEFYIVLNGAFPNGTVFAYTLPATSSSVTHAGEAVDGHLGRRRGLPQLCRSLDVTVALNAPELGVTGTLEIQEQ
ncbi:hypothetical protein NUW54_g10259 [Trametes sanguinea]|uniref:Uncharacterized protein n=1 Tax=Trametes sanguinea TaxID=158606 RepID=A0ACC1P0T4_9APHY|nr:hypothetical protein NUW54_g10259 [Trametes sanguinea]